MSLKLWKKYHWKNEKISENIDNSLLSASIISEVTNHTPIAGNLSLIISNNDSFFPLFIDSLIVDDEICIEDTCVYNNNSLSFDNAINKLESGYPNNELGNNFIQGINLMEYIPMSDSDSRMKQVKFYTDSNDSLWIGRIVDFELPYPLVDINGNVSEPGVASIISDIDPVQIDMINQSDLNGNRYLNSFISIQSTYDLNGDGIIDENEDGIVNLHSYDYISILSYVSFLINAGNF